MCGELFSTFVAVFAPYNACSRKLYMENKKNHSLTYAAEYRSFDISIVGLQMADGWLLSVQINKWGRPPMALWRDRDHRYPDFNCLRTAGLQWSRQFIDNSMH